MKAYVITCNCNPHDAKTRHHFEDVLKYNGMTPVSWVYENEYYDHKSDAMAALDRLAHYLECQHDNWHFEDQTSIEEIEKEALKYDIENATDWYKGKGLYEGQQLIWQAGDESLYDDVMMYRVEEVE